jgi:chromosome segregation ATPase
MFDKEKKDKKDRTIEVQQGIIKKLEEEISQLKSENNSLKQQLEFEKAIPKEGYEKAKVLMSDLENKIEEYKILIEEVKQIKVSYSEKIKEIDEIKAKYQQDLKDFLKKVKRSVKK